MSRVLLMSFGNGGHHIAARAIETALHQTDPAVRTICIDPLNRTHPRIGALMHHTYLGVLRRVPLLWEAIYDNLTLARLAKRLDPLAREVGRSALHRCVEGFNPDAVVCTQAYPFSTMSALSRDHDLGPPLFGVITDFRPHRFWVHEIGTYVVPTSSAADVLHSYGVSEDRIRIFGIPVRSAFEPNANHAKSPGVKRVLVTGGTYGLGFSERTIEEIDRCEAEFAIDVVTGLNFRLQAKLVAMSRLFRHPIRVEGYVDDIIPLMSQASLLVGKAGGLTCAEALILGLPMVILHPLPGQEIGNAEELIKNRVAVPAESEHGLASIVTTLFHQPELLDTMSARARTLARPDASTRLAQEVLIAASRLPCLRSPNPASHPC